MMKAVILSVFLFASLALADVSYTGYISQANTTFLPTSYGPCTTGSSAYYFSSFTYTTTTAGVRAILGLGNIDYVSVYTGSFTPATPCVNAIQTYATGSYYASGRLDNSQVLDLSAGFYLGVGTYTIVVFANTGATTTFSTSYAFGVKVLDPVIAASTNGSSNGWMAPRYTSANTVTNDSQNYSFVSGVFTPTTTGFYDIGVFAQNSTAASNSYVSLGVFQGTPTYAQILAASPGTAGAYNYFPNDNRNYLGVWAFYIQLTAGTPVTLVGSAGAVGGDNTNFGFFVAPTSAAMFSSANTYNSATYGSLPSTSTGTLPTCTVDSSHTAQPYVAKAYSVAGNIFLAESSDGDSFNTYMPNYFTGFDFETQIYRGTNVNPPTACPLTSTYVGGQDTGLAVDPAAGTQTHTVVTQAWSSSPPTITATSGAVVFAFGGTTLNGPAAVVTTTTAAPGGNTTTTVSPGGNTTTTTKAPTTSSTPTTSTTNSASTVFASVAVVVFAALALLF